MQSNTWGICACICMRVSVWGSLRLLPSATPACLEQDFILIRPYPTPARLPALHPSLLQLPYQTHTLFPPVPSLMLPLPSFLSFCLFPAVLPFYVHVALSCFASTQLLLYYLHYIIAIQCIYTPSHQRTDILLNTIVFLTVLTIRLHSRPLGLE